MLCNAWITFALPTGRRFCWVPHLRSIARDREVIGNEYMVFGTVDKIYRKSDKVCKYTDDILQEEGP